MIVIFARAFSVATFLGGWWVVNQYFIPDKLGSFLTTLLILILFTVVKVKDLS